MSKLDEKSVDELREEVKKLRSDLRKSRQVIKKQEMRLEQLYFHVPVVYMRLNRSGRIIVVNKTFEKYRESFLLEYFIPHLQHYD